MQSTFKTVPASSMILRDDIAARASLLAGRLEKKEYRPETISDQNEFDWPGDWEGRSTLGITRLAIATKKEPAFLHDIVKAVLASRNAGGYLGNVLAEGDAMQAHEQQLSGHGWLLRGLLAYYRYTGKREVLDAALRIGHNLFVPLIELYRDYPDTYEEHACPGEQAGDLVGIFRNWRISSDTSCAFIPLDGLTELYELTEDKEIKKLLDVMIDRFVYLDHFKMGSQTHATLSGTRGILRMYRITGEKRYLDEAIRIFELYTTCGMTANYENYNWFGRLPWGEPCAVIDSFMCAMQLYMATRDRKYLTLAQRIYFTGMGFEQRENGGYGSNTAVGANGIPNNRIIKKYYEECHFCCSMRGGEGLASVGEYAYLIDDAERTVTVPYFISNDTVLDIAGETVKLSARTRYPYKSSANYAVTQNDLKSPVTLAVYLPDAAENVKVDGAAFSFEGGFVYITVDSTTENIAITFDLPLKLEIPVGNYNDKDCVAIFFGNAMMSIDAEEEVAPLGGVISDELNAKLHPLFDAYEQGHKPRRVLFEN